MRALTPCFRGTEMIFKNKTSFLILLCMACVSCAHQSSHKKEASLRVENKLLKERVRRLEHRVRDLDAKIMFLAQNKNKNKVLKKKAAPRQSLRKSIDLDVSQEDLQVAFQAVESDREQGPGRASNVGGALGVTESFEAEPPVTLTIGPKTTTAKKVAHVPVAVSKETQGTVLDTKDGFAYMAKAEPQYEWARQQLLAHQCERAIPAFQNILKRFPKHDLADNALYWSAFCFAELGNSAEAIKIVASTALSISAKPQKTRCPISECDPYGARRQKDRGDKALQGNLKAFS